MNDIQELIEEARGRVDRMTVSNLVDRLADALEALNRENEELAALTKGAAWCTAWENDCGEIRLTPGPVSAYELAAKYNGRALKRIEHGPWVEVSS